MPVRRLQEVRRHLEKARLDALVVSHLPHIRYLTGFSGSNGLCVVSRNRQFVLTDNRYRDQIRDEVEGFRIHIARANIFEAAQKHGVLKGARRVGFEAQHISVSAFRTLQKLFPKISFVPTHSVVEAIAAVKDEGEIDSIRRAVAITDRVFGRILEILKPGVMEMDIAAEIGYWHKKFGAEGDGFEPIVASGARGALPHARPTMKKIKKGEFVTLDLGCRVNGYHSDLTRTVAVGKPGEKARTIYRVVLEAQSRAIEAARAGAKNRLLDNVARRHIRRSGFGPYFSHSLGHGLGIEIHEPLRLSALSMDILQAGNVVTVEPGIYIPGFGGVRIEDDIVIREHDCEVLNTAPKELLVV
jgi:Xaa-Pro aminopeptidase